MKLDDIDKMPDIDEQEVTDGKKAPKIYGLEDLSAIEELDDQTEINAEADAFELVQPPDMGNYLCKIGLGENGIQIKETQRGAKVQYYSVEIEAELQSDNPNIQGARVRKTLTTNVGRGKQTSTLATLLNKNGFTISGAIKGKDQLSKLVGLIKSEKLVPIKVDWGAGFTDEKKNFHRTHNSQKDFKKNPDGTYIFRLSKRLDNGTLVNYGAFLNIIEFISTGDFGKKKTATTASISLASLPASNETLEELEKGL